MLLLLLAAEPERRDIQPTPRDLERFQVPRAASADAVELRTDGTPLFKISGVGMFAASAADFATTEMGLSRGFQEGNPIASNRGARLVHHLLGPAAVYWTSDRLQKNGKPRLALGLRLALMAAYSYAAIHNLRVSGEPLPAR
jgi:hypothetical protein